jgi:hypothetical protein
MFVRSSYRLREPDLRDCFPEREPDFELRPVLPDLVDDLVDLRLPEDAARAPALDERDPRPVEPVAARPPPVPRAPAVRPPVEPVDRAPDERALAGREP